MNAAGIFRLGCRAAVCVVALNATVYAAADGTTSQPAPAIRFRVFALRPPAGLAFQPAAGASFQPIEFYPTARSPEYVCTGPMPLRFLDAAGNSVAEVQLPATSSQALLIFVPRRDGNGRRPRFDILAFEDPPTAPSAGRFAVLNLSGLSLHGTFSGRRVAIGPGWQRLPGQGRLELRTTHAGREYRAYSDHVALPAGERGLLILFPPFYAGSLEVQGRMLRDDVPEETGPSRAVRP